MAKLDLYINSDETWGMDVQFWTNPDKTLPLDITGNIYKGAFDFGGKCVPITFNVGYPDVNVLQCRVEAYQLSHIPSQGTYAITAERAGDKIRVFDGLVIVDRGQACT